MVDSGTRLDLVAVADLLADIGAALVALVPVALFVALLARLVVRARRGRVRRGRRSTRD